MQTPLPPPPASGAGQPAAAATPPPPPGEPHPALFVVLLHLRLPELLSLRQVCQSLRDAVAGDPLLWWELVVAPPLSERLTDGVLWDLTSRAAGKLRSLGLFGCWRITDGGLRRVVEANPYISKLSLPECFCITADNTTTLVRSLANTNGQGFLQRVWLHGISNVSKEHLVILNSLVRTSAHKQDSQFFYPQWHTSHLRDDDDHPIDIQLCPRCKNVRMVFDCPRENCRLMKGRLTKCRGCFFCIPRCEDCGVCLGREEDGEETICSHLLCLQCWLLRPKCALCNRPYCERDSTLDTGDARTTVFICLECGCHYEWDN